MFFPGTYGYFWILLGTSWYLWVRQVFLILSTIKCRIELGTLFSLLCNLVCVNAFATLKMCVCIGSKYLQKIREKSLQNRAKRDFCNVFREFFANIEILYTHTFEVWQKHEHILNCIVAKTKYPVKSFT